MPSPNLDRRDDPLPCFRGRRSITLGNADYTLPGHGFFAVANGTSAQGTLRVEYADGTLETVTLAGGASITGPGSGLVGVRRILDHAETTLATVIIGIF
ncbi:MAG: hypothetical protein OXH56_00300 [Gemmatimonadetes bacterium]|nr:hypothetical protein [Gemmatimonadota bacterium]